MKPLHAILLSLLLILGCDPVYDAPADWNFAEALKKVKLRAHMTTHANETSRLCQWAIPMTHYLESWGDAEPAAGVVLILAATGTTPARMHSTVWFGASEVGKLQAARLRTLSATVTLFSGSSPQLVTRTR